MSPTSLPLSSWSRRLEKAGDAPEDNGDAVRSDDVRGRYAVADGAAGSGYAQVWSRLLVDQFVAAGCAADEALAGEGAAGPVAEPPPAAPWDWLLEAQRQWLAEVGGQARPWYGERQFQQGAFATFLGVTLEAVADEWRWTAVAIGDSCLFHTRGNQLLRAFPITSAADFGCTPQLVGSRSPQSRVSEIVVQATEPAQPGDRLWLLTDALSQWFLGEFEQGRSPCDDLDALQGDVAEDEDRAKRFSTWIEELRAAALLRNDDVAVVCIELPRMADA